MLLLGTCPVRSSSATSNGMNIEQLTKAQIVLLTLLVSFVTSIATGIVTVTLMDQAPPAITQTINRVVTQTVEKVVPMTNQIASTNKEVVYVKEQNLVAEIIDKTNSVFGKIYSVSDKGETFVGYGVFVDKEGILVASGLSLVGGENYAVYVGEKRFDLSQIGTNNKKQVVYLKAIDKDGGILKTVFKEASIVNPDSLKLGQSVIVLGGVENTEVLMGIISGFVKDKGNDSMASASSTEIISASLHVLDIKTNIAPASILTGAPLVNLNGEVIGISVDAGTGSFVPLNFVNFDIKNLSV